MKYERCTYLWVEHYVIMGYFIAMSLQENNSGWFAPKSGTM